MIKETIFKFHLYPISEEFTIPAVSEYGEDIEFTGNELHNLMYYLTTYIACNHSEFQLNEEDSVSSPLLQRWTYYYNDDMNFRYSLNFVVDSNPAPQRDPVVCAKRRALADAGELGQRWWIHHVDLPDGQVIDCDNVTAELREAARAVVVRQVDEYADQIQSMLKEEE